MNRGSLIKTGEMEAWKGGDDAERRRDPADGLGHGCGEWKIGIGEARGPGQRPK